VLHPYKHHLCGVISDVNRIHQDSIGVVDDTDIEVVDMDMGVVVDRDTGVVLVVLLLVVPVQIR